MDADHRAHHTRTGSTPCQRRVDGRATRRHPGHNARPVEATGRYGTAPVSARAMPAQGQRPQALAHEGQPGMRPEVEPEQVAGFRVADAEPQVIQRHKPHRHRLHSAQVTARAVVEDRHRGRLTWRVAVRRARRRPSDFMSLRVPTVTRTITVPGSAANSTAASASPTADRKLPG
jgi:hypothetical protein